MRRSRSRRATRPQVGSDCASVQRMMSIAGERGTPGPSGPGSHTGIVIRQCAAAEWQVYRRLRLSALTNAPDAFGSTLAVENDWPETLWEERLRTGVQSAHDLPLLALADDEPAGLAWGKIDAASRSIAHVYQMWVAPAHRRRGIGADLLVALIVWAHSRNAVQVVLSVTSGDSPARRLYERMGFKADGELASLRPGSATMTQQMKVLTSESARH